MQPVTVDHDAETSVAHLHGDLGTPVVPALYASLRALAGRRDLERLVLDFADAGRLDSAAIASVSLVEQQLVRRRRQLELRNLADHHRAAFALVPPVTPIAAPSPRPGVFARIGARTDATRASTGDLVELAGDTVKQTATVTRWRFAKRRANALVERRPHLPPGSVVDQLARMGADAVFVVGLLSCLLGMTTAFQGATQLRRFGAGVFVADVIGVSMVRELAPLVTAIILTGRTGAAIAAELGTMKVRSELDALSAMGIDPVRFLVVPRLLALTVIGPALTLMAMFIGMLGGMLVAAWSLDMAPTAYWSRVIYRVDLGDFVHGVGKSLVFAWIIGLAGCHLGLRTRADASSVGAATTRTVVASVFFIIVADAVFATVSTYLRYR